jgi:putative phosphoribosyl transferase
MGFLTHLTGKRRCEMMRFRDRKHAGSLLADLLMVYTNNPDVIVLALPRGGVPVAYPVAEALNAPLDVFLVRKLGVPGQEELAFGAIADGLERPVFYNDVLADIRLDPNVIEEIIYKEKLELERRKNLYRGTRPFPELSGKTVILIDDGLATGTSMLAAVHSLQRHKPARLLVAVPVAPPAIYRQFQPVVDEVVCLLTPGSLIAIGLWYQDFSQTSDEEVINLLEKADSRYLEEGAAAK